MAGFETTSKPILRAMQRLPRLLYRLGLGWLVGGTVLLLTTTGRRTGAPRSTPLQYEIIDGRIYLCAALGLKADWVRNLQANPQAGVCIGSRHFTASAEIITDAAAIADFLSLRLERHPRMVGGILRAAGVDLPPARPTLEDYARRLALVVLTPG